ncbi:unnamed protein product [Durusdinium trenchii]|uniref:Uncharacterized protein n=1 Tax=Durusdinium trenchii TaxID=1381693 RepID=A0ABP0QWG1_9DINO
MCRSSHERPSSGRDLLRAGRRSERPRGASHGPACEVRTSRHEEAGRRSEGLPEALGDPSPSIPLGTPNLTGERTQAEDDEPAMSAPRRSLEVPNPSPASPVEPELKPRISRHEEADRESEEALGNPSPSTPLGTPDSTGERTQVEDDEPAVSGLRRSLEVPAASPVEPELKPRLSRHEEAGRRSEGLPEALGDPSPSIPLGTPNLTGERTQAEDDEPAMSAPRRSLEVPNPSPASPVEPELKPRLSRQSGAELAEYAAAELREAGVLQSDEESGAEAAWQ